MFFFSLSFSSHFISFLLSFLFSFVQNNRFVKWYIKLEWGTIWFALSCPHWMWSEKKYFVCRPSSFFFALFPFYLVERFLFVSISFSCSSSDSFNWHFVFKTYFAFLSVEWLFSMNFVDDWMEKKPRIEWRENTQQLWYCEFTL